MTRHHLPSKNTKNSSYGKHITLDSIEENEQKEIILKTRISMMNGLESHILDNL
jgi:hypothetical protein